MGSKKEESYERKSLVKKDGSNSRKRLIEKERFYQKKKSLNREGDYTGRAWLKTKNFLLKKNVWKLDLKGKEVDEQDLIKRVDLYLKRKVWFKTIWTQFD